MKPKDLRDEFAMAAMPYLVHHALDETSSYEHGGKKITPSEYVAASAFAIADAMMAEREKTNEA